MRILLIGSLPPPVGGTAVSFKLLCDRLRSHPEVQVRVINTAGIRGHRFLGPFRFARTLISICILVFRVDVISLHLAPTAIPFLGPIVLVYSRLSRRPLILRIFAGLDYMQMSPLRSKLAHFVARHSDLYLAQTKQFVGLAKKRGIEHVEWYPTSRAMPSDEHLGAAVISSCLRFVFVGDVNDVKGVREIIAIDKMLPDSVWVDIFGPLTGGISLEDFDDCTKVHYKGTLVSEQVIRTIEQYDALLLPTYHNGEGYPGVIIEAYAAGLPVICTRWKALPELVDQTSGILIPIRDADALLVAMKSLIEDKGFYARLCQGARDRRRQFSLDFWVDRFVFLCAKVAEVTQHKSL